MMGYVLIDCLMLGRTSSILFIITLVIFSFYLHRHRKARATTNQTEPSTGVMSQGRYEKTPSGLKGC